MQTTLLDSEKQHLAHLLEAIQRCVFFLDAASSLLTWPLDADLLEQEKKNTKVFGALAAVNERFAKLQDTLGAGMRHALVLLSEPADTFLQVLAFYEKVGVIESIAAWQTCRTARNIAAHEYDIDYESITEHFNTLHSMQPLLYNASRDLVRYCHQTLAIKPATADFSAEFELVVERGAG